MAAVAEEAGAEGSGQAMAEAMGAGPWEAEVMGAAAATGSTPTEIISAADWLKTASYLYQ